MNDDKMRAEFEAWAESQDCIAHRGEGGSYWHPDVRKAWKVWQAAYQAGRMAAFSEWYAMEFEKWRKQGDERAAEWHAELERYKKEKQPEGE